MNERERRFSGEKTAHPTSTARTTDKSLIDYCHRRELAEDGKAYAVDIGRRLEAAWRLAPLDDFGRIDPLAISPYRRRPSSFSLTPGALYREAVRCCEAGWQSWETRIVFERPEGFALEEIAA